MFKWFKRPDKPPETGSSSPALDSARASTGHPVRDLNGDGWHVRLDLAPQVLSLGIPIETTWQEDHGELAPTCPDSRGFVSASMLAVKAKLFDDGLYAAAEIAAQPGKARLLTALAGVADPVAAAARLGGIKAPLSPSAEALIDPFLADERLSKPLGFYTWSDSLRRIFQQDRLLQQRLTRGEAAALTAALDADPSIKAAYATYLDLAARLTNPLVADQPDLRQPGGAWFFPPSRSHESDLMKRLYANRPIPDGFSLADEVIARLRDGSLSLQPTATSGWYDWQTWALEPLVLLDRMPEAARLKTNDRYREQLQELFKAILSLTRETHVKQLESRGAGAAMAPRNPRVLVWVRPELTVEPLATYYQRRATGYEFVRDALPSLAPLKTMRRLTSVGPVGPSLDEELAGMIALFRGAAAVASHELGMESEAGAEAGRFGKWASRPDIVEDVRMMVPLFYDIGRGQTKVWAILGWAERRLEISFATPPAVHVVEGDVDVRFSSAYRTLVYPVFAEAYVSRLLDRDEFRAHCDRYRTREAILRNL